VRSCLIGLSIAIPVGPIGLLVIRRTLINGRLHGFVSGLGAATADALYGCIAAFGLSAVSALLLENVTWLNVLGGVFLIYLGLRIFFSPPIEAEAPSPHPTHGLFGAYTSTLALTLTNPMTIFTFLGIFAGLGVVNTDGVMGGGVMVLGVFIGSALWWLALSGGMSLLRGRMSTRVLRLLNGLSGAVIVLFGLSVLF
jgi:threonine/homoserine/homoserine lactone efflux protein